jgi:hypothetical protein
MAFSAARPPRPTRSGKPIGISTATMRGASGAASTSAKRGRTVTLTSAPGGGTNTATQPVRQPSTPASQMSAGALSRAPSVTSG